MMKKTILLPLLIVVSLAQINAQTSPVIELKWIDNFPVTERVGVSWGVPFTRGTVKKNQSFSLTNGEGKSLPVQAWPTAYWPDGSIKWSGFATLAGTIDGPLMLSVSNAKTGSTESGLQ